MKEAFPPLWQSEAVAAARLLDPFFDPTYRRPPIILWSEGCELNIPSRLHLTPPEALTRSSDRVRLVAGCLCTRSTGGHVRQFSVRHIIQSPEPATVPFVILLAADYVVQVVEEIALHLPALDRAAYALFVRENRSLMQTLRARATSYWDLHHRDSYPDRRDYPGLHVLHEVERWAA